MNIQLRLAALGGLISLFFIPPEIYLEHQLNIDPQAQWLLYIIIFIYVASVLSTVALYNGFYLIGKKFNIPAIVISCILIILLKIIWYVFQIFAIQEPISFYNIFGGTVLVVFGVSRIVFGYGIYKVRSELGKPSTSIAVLEILVGLFLISVIAYLGGLVLSLIVAILQIILLLRLSKSIK